LLLEGIGVRAVVIARTAVAAGVAGVVRFGVVGIIVTARVRKSEAAVVIAK
jgi:hypothetical protein